ncbi:MBL fold metallo-hydrolase [Deferribacter thermophilus]|uniref:MBL fold metallo-hydrolase n=1 Tax=Deferribacter thermophilus TaxID=53573 RepID=UPI003C22F2E6
MKITNLTDNLFLIDQKATYTCGLDLDGEVVLFDSCLDLSIAKKIDKLLGKKIKAIFHTHSHADHVGGDFFFYNKYRCDVYIHKNELSFLSYPYLEPSLLYGGAAYTAITGKFLKAEKIETALPFDSALDLLKELNIELIDLSGHSPAQTGFKFKDVIFVGDALFSEDLIDKYKILYLFYPKSYLKSLETLESLEYKKIIFCHKGYLSKDEALEIIKSNKSHLFEVYKTIYKIADGKTAEEITDILIDRLEIHINMDLISLVNSTVKGYLSWLELDNKLRVYYDKGVRWKQIQ